MKKEYIISLKVNSVYPMDLSAVMYDTEWGDGRVISDYIPGVVDPSGKATKDELESVLLSATARVYKKFADKTSAVIIHNPNQYALSLESKLFTSMLEKGLIDELPPLIDVGTILLQFGEETNSIEDYIRKKRLASMVDYSCNKTLPPQHPLFDA